jgi:hypothetical protein
LAKSLLDTTCFIKKGKKEVEVYQVINGPARIPAGTVVRLSESQVLGRVKQLRKLESGWFLALIELSFTTGEVLTFSKPLDQSLLLPFTPPEMQRPIAGHPNHRKKTKKVTAC